MSEKVNLIYTLQRVNPDGPPRDRELPFKVELKVEENPPTDLEWRIDKGNDKMIWFKKSGGRNIEEKASYIPRYYCAMIDGIYRLRVPQNLDTEETLKYIEGALDSMLRSISAEMTNASEKIDKAISEREAHNEKSISLNKLLAGRK